MQKNNHAFYQRIPLPFKIKRPVLALGTQTKNTVCFAKGRFAVLSPVHPHLDDPQDYRNFVSCVKSLLKQRPRVIACDLHPEYQSTKYALSLLPQQYRFMQVQHHHAHIASCMVDCGLTNQKVIGVAFDGTGLGREQKIWGAEFLVCDYKSFRRRAHLKEIPLLGGEKAVLEPWRILAAWFNFNPDSCGINKNKLRLLQKAYLAGFNFPFASSMGRLFDAAAALVFHKYRVGAEAELPVALEALASRYRDSDISYPLRIKKDQGVYIIDPLPMLKKIILDLKHKVPQEKIAYSFHLTIAEMIKRVCLALRRENKLNKVVLSGGVFQNTLLLKLAVDLLYKEGFKVYTHQNIPCSDAGVALGQVAIANF